MSFFPSSNLFIIPSEGCLDSQFVDDLLISSTEFELILEVGIFVKFSSDKFWGFFASSSSFVLFDVKEAEFVFLFEYNSFCKVF